MSPPPPPPPPPSGSGDILFFLVRLSVHYKIFKTQTPTVLARFFLLFRCICQGLKMCMTFGCNPQINFCHFLGSSGLVIFGFTAFRHWVSCECISYRFSWIFLKLCWSLNQCLKMCMKICCNPKIHFCHFFGSSYLVIFSLTTLTLSIL